MILRLTVKSLLTLVGTLALSPAGRGLRLEFLGDLEELKAKSVLRKPEVNPPGLFNLFLGGKAGRWHLHFRKCWTQQNLREPDNQLLNKDVSGRSGLGRNPNPSRK